MTEIYRRDLDNQGCCNQWQHGIRTINNQYPDDNRDFDINAGDGIEITPATAGITIAVKAPLPGPMVYQGTVGTGGTVATLPAANVTNIGWTYVAITAGSTPDDTPKSYEIGDMLVSNGEEWTVIPAGDDPVLWSDIQNKPTTLSGYGITDAVDIGSAQTITGAKTFNSDVLSYLTIRSDRTSGNLGSLDYKNGNDVVKTQCWVNNNGKYEILLADGPYKCATVKNQRAYDSANTEDIVTIGTLASNTNVVHTTGNEEIAGDKIFLDKITKKISGITSRSDSTSTGKTSDILWTANNGDVIGILRFQQDNGKRSFRICLRDGSDSPTWTVLSEITI